jgi:hypothetical protein
MTRFLLTIFIFLFSQTVLAFNLTSANDQRSTINHQRLTANGPRPMNSDLNRQAFYKAMQSGSRSLVDEQINLLQSPAGKYEAFEGALSMKKAGFIGPAHTKIRLFRDGHKMLESAIQKDPTNAEYRFLRLMIQEHAPPFLGYNKDIGQDSEYIRKMYKSLPEDLQLAIARYNKKSKNLKLDLS